MVTLFQANSVTVNRETCLREDLGLEKRVACVKSNYIPILLFSVGANDSTFSSHSRMQAASNLQNTSMTNSSTRSSVLMQIF